MSNIQIFKTTPKIPYEFDIEIPRDMDLPFSVQLHDPGDDCNCSPANLTPYNTAGHEFEFRIYNNKLDDDADALVEFLNADWATFISEGQDGTAYADIVGRTFKAAELALLEKGRSYWFRFHGIDADEVSFIIGRGNFTVNRF